MKSPGPIKRTLTVCGIVVGPIVLLWCLWPDSPSKSVRNNDVYLSHIGEIIVKYQKIHGQTPVSEDDAFTELKETLPHRGDYYGKSLGYLRVSNTAFSLEASNCQVYYANGEKVTRDEFIKWVRSYPDPGVNTEDVLKIYRPFFAK